MYHKILLYLISFTEINVFNELQIFARHRYQVGTPVTADSFAKWSIAKNLRKQAEAEARVKAEQAKKKGGKGLCTYCTALCCTCYVDNGFMASYSAFLNERAL